MTAIFKSKPVVSGWMYIALCFLPSSLYSQKSEQDEKTVDVYLEKASEYSSLKVSDSCLFYLNKALEIAEEKSSKDELFKVYMQYSKYLYNNGNYSIALEYTYKALNTLDQEAIHYQDAVPSLLQKRYFTIHSEIGLNYLSMDHTKEGLKHFETGLGILNSLEGEDTDFVKERRHRLYTNIGSAYLMENDLDSASVYYSKALESLDKEKNLKELSVIYNNLGIICKEKKEYRQANDYYQKSLKIRSQLKDTLGLAQVYNNTGNVYYFQRNYAKAIPVLQKALWLSKQSGGGIKSEMLAAQFLSNCYEQTRDYKSAFEMQKLSQQLNDSLMGTERIRIATQLGLEYQYKKQLKDQELEQQLKLKEKEKSILFAIIL
ncbi:MAG: tetratricopeptide repeat protein, partial [Prevotellaceae bacterium]|nr:tetratricopeptide repeat protein [Prevotellaceae bacterium]